MDGFKVPQTIPQDLLLIQEFIDAALPSNTENVSKRVVEDDISSSCSEGDDSSEEEIAADLTKSADGDEDTKPVNNTCVFLTFFRNVSLNMFKVWCLQTQAQICLQTRTRTRTQNRVD